MSANDPDLSPDARVMHEGKPDQSGHEGLTQALERALRRLGSGRHDGYYEGFSDTGVAFDAANLILSRFVGETWPEPTDRVALKLRHILAGQHESGLFLLYPGGPCNLQATQIVCLAFERVLEANGSRLPGDLRKALRASLSKARLALVHPPEHFELIYLFCFRWMLEALDANARSPTRLFPTLLLWILFPVMLVGLIPKGIGRRLDRIVYPFISVLPQLLSLAAWRAVATSTAGAALLRRSNHLPISARLWKTQIGERALRWLLARQDLTGGFYYSPLYTYLFVAAVREALALVDDKERDKEGVAAIERALAYIRLRETSVPTGIATSFVASDVWDTTAVATALLEAPKELVLQLDSMGSVDSTGTPEKLAEYALEQQSESGGFSYGRGSHYPDVDTTGLVLGLFAAVLARKPNATNRDALLTSLTRAFDFLELHHDEEGGFNAWTLRHGADAPPVGPNLTSLLFDVSSADVTARIMVSLARLLDVAERSLVVADELGPHRLERARRMRALGLEYLLSMRDGSVGLWPARWSLGFVIGTRFVFDALATYPEITLEIEVLRDAAARTLLQQQHVDGGFGESPDSDVESRYTSAHLSSPVVTAAAYEILSGSNKPRAREAAARALAYLTASQNENGAWPEASVCTQFSGLYASYELMTQVSLVTALFRAQKKNDAL